MKHIARHQEISRKIAKQSLFAIVFFLLLIFADMLLGFRSLSFILRFLDTNVLSYLEIQSHKNNLLYQYFAEGRTFISMSQQLSDASEKQAQLETRLTLIEQENNSLREALDLKKLTTHRSIFVSLKKIYHEQDGTYYSIDRGGEDGIQVGQIVLSKNGYAIAKVFSVEKNNSLLRSLQNTSCFLSANILNEQRSLALLSGDLEFGMTVKELPVTENVKKDDILVSSGQEELIPYGIPLGKVIDVVYREGALFKTVLVESPVDFGNYFDVAQVILGDI